MKYRHLCAATAQVVRTRLTADNIGRYSGIVDTFGRIIQYEGVRGLYRGLLPSVAAIIPEAAITCASWRRVTMA